MCVAAIAAAATGANAQAQSSDGTRAARVQRRADAAPNDAALGEFVDSLFAPIPPADPLPGAAARTLGVEPSKAARRPQWSARLAHNPSPGDGNPPYALIDRYGGVQRYVETVPGVELEQFVGQTVAVRRDTGHTLLASQLELPRRSPARAAVAAKRAASGVQTAAFQEPTPALEPDRADDGLPTPTPAADDAAPEPIPQGAVEQGARMRDVVPMNEGEIISEGPMFDENGHPMSVPDGVDPLYVDEGYSFDSCAGCGSGICGGNCGSGCGFGSRPIWYVRGEYLLWWFDGMDAPPLVVQDTNLNDNVRATTLIGGDELLDGSRDGGRVILGFWFDDYGKTGFEGDYLGFSTFSSNFLAGDFNQANDLFIFRPFFNTVTIPGVVNRGPALQDVDTDLVTGTVAVDADSEFQTAGIRLRRNLCCAPGCTTGCGDCVTCGTEVCHDCPILGHKCGQLLRSGTRHTDVMVGLRWAQLDERLSITEDLIVTADNTTILLNDTFATDNEFLGGELGFIWEWMSQRWSLEVLSKLAIGNTRQRVYINGSTVFDRGTAGEDPNSGGLLAQNTNIGAYERDRFSMIPEVGATLGYLVTDRLRFTFGYSLLYWSNVVRPGDQIDIDVNSTLVPRFQGVPQLVAMDHPRFVFRQTDMWAQGFNLGLDYRW